MVQGGIMLCEICGESQHKYKCPKCLLKYCSLPCFKTHKASSCDSKTLSNVAQQNGDLLGTGNNKACDRLQGEGSEETDQIPSTVLNRLGLSRKLRNMLRNPHLQELVLDLNLAPDPASSLEKLMKEPIFTEFADACLKVVGKEDMHSES